MATPKSGSSQGMEDNLKKAVTEMLVLTLLKGEDMYAGQILESMERRSGGALNIVFPYAVLYRLIAPDGRRRQYYQITEQGWRYVDELTGLYRRFIGGVELLLEGGEAHGE